MAIYIGTMEVKKYLLCTQGRIKQQCMVTNDPSLILIIWRQEIEYLLN